MTLLSAPNALEARQSAAIGGKAANCPFATVWNDCYLRI
jgi:hypothetical protein